MSILPSGLQVCRLHGASRQCTTWSTAPHIILVNIGGSLEGVHRRKLSGPPEESADINYSVEVHDQVQVKK